jgi:ribonuclease D
MLMMRDYGWQLQNLFDTMWAVRILGHNKVGLANVLEHYFNIELDKKYQKSNWCHRPLSAGELAYAQHDTHFLASLRDVLAAEIQAAGYWEEAQEIFAEQSVIKLPDTSFSPDDFWRLNGVTKLKPDEQAIVKALFIYRDTEARRQNRPHFKIFGNKTILLLAQEKPHDMEDLRQIRGMSFGQIRRYGRHILRIVQENVGSSAPKRPPRRPRTPDDVVDRYEKLHQWRKNRGQARGVESDVILTRDSLWALAYENPQSLDQLVAMNVLGPWRVKTYGTDLIQHLRTKEG